MHALGFDYALRIRATTTVWRLDSRERRRGEPLSAGAISELLGIKPFRRVAWPVRKANCARVPPSAV